MNKLFLSLQILWVFSYCTNSLYAQSDSTMMERYISKAEDLFENDWREKYDSIFYYFEKAEKIAQSNSYYEREAYSFLARFTAANYKKDYNLASLHAKKAYALIKSELPANHPFHASASNNLGIIYSNFHNYNKAIALVKESISFLKQYPNISEAHEKSVLYHLNLGNFFAHTGDFNEAINIYEQGLKMGLDSLQNDSRRLKSRIASLYFNLGLKSLIIQNYPSAIHYLKSNIAFIQDHLGGALEKEIDTHNSLANAYFETGEVKNALQHIQKAEELQQVSIDKYGEGWHEDITLTTKARCFAELRKFDEAFQIMETSFQKVERPSYKTDFWGNGYKDYGILLAKNRQYDSALKKYQSALIQFVNNFNSEEIYLSPKAQDFEAVKVFHAETIRLKTEALLNLYKEKKELKDLEAAFKNGQLFIELIEKIRKNIETEGGQLYLSGQAKVGFELAIRSSIEFFKQTKNEKYLFNALKFSEKAKGIVLYASLNDTRAKFVANVPQKVLEEEYDAKSRISYLKSTIFDLKYRTSELDSIRISELEDQLFQSTQDLGSINKKLQEEYPTYYQLKYQQQEFNPNQIQKALPRSTLLFEYFTGDSALYLFTLSTKGIDYKLIEHSAELYPQVDHFVKSLHQINGQGSKLDLFKSTAFSISKRLLIPSWEDYKNLLIIPDGILGLLPFEILLKHEEGSHFGELPYLLKDHNVQYAYSAQLLFNDPLKEQVKAAQKNWAGFAPQFEGLKTLPLSIEEVEQIAQLMQGETYTHQRADKTTFLAEAKDYRILHLATHGYPNVENPQFASLEFTAQDGSNDGILYAHELMNERLAAELAVLSACETGYGSIAKGEGIMSLARSFRYAGVPSIVMSLWKAESGVSKKIMASFYTYLQDGKGKDEALRLAKLDYLKAPLPGRSHPRAWSHFVLIGDAEPLKKSQPWIWIFSLLVPALVVILLAFRRKKLITKAPI